MNEAHIYDYEMLTHAQNLKFEKKKEKKFHRDWNIKINNVAKIDTLKYTGK